MGGAIGKYIRDGFMGFKGDLTPEAWFMTIASVVGIAALTYFLARGRHFKWPYLLLFAAILLGLVYYFTFYKAGR